MNSCSSSRNDELLCFDKVFLSFLPRERLNVFDDVLDEIFKKIFEIRQGQRIVQNYGEFLTKSVKRQLALIHGFL